MMANLSSNLYLFSTAFRPTSWVVHDLTKVVAYAIYVTLAVEEEPGKLEINWNKFQKVAEMLPGMLFGNFYMYKH